MFGRKKKKKLVEPEASLTELASLSSDPSKVKYDKPKILLIDIPSSCEDVLISAGYNVKSGTFGIPYPVPRSDKAYPVSKISFNLPNHEEQEIVIASTARPPSDESMQDEEVEEGVDHLWQTAANGNIDPRPLAMFSTKPVFDRIWRFGGIFIVLLKAKYPVEYTFGSLKKYSSVEEYSKIEKSSWGFLSELDSFTCNLAHGIEFNFNSRAKRLTDLLAHGLKEAEYRCTIEPSYENKENWVPLAHDKFGNCVAGILVYDDPPRHLLLLPDMPHFDRILLPLIEEWCAQWNPELFPFHEGQQWIHRPEYEVPKILELQEQANKVKINAETQVEQIESEIKQLQEDNKDWYTLLNGTGDELVAAVIRSLRRLGFKKVEDVDAELKEQGNGQNLREDIQIHDNSTILVVDVKGIQGNPEDADATQAEKHALMRTREFDAYVKPLTIINHQRNIPPHDRDSVAYRKEIIGNAEHTGLGLMTTWDLFLLLRNKDKLGWTDEMVIPIFYRTGRIDPIPEHYQQIGTIEHVWRNAIGIVPSVEIHAGATLAVESGDTFEEIIVESLQVEDQKVDVAPIDSNCGIAFSGTSERFREGMRVYLVDKS